MDSVVCGPAPCDGGTTTLIVKRLGCLFKLKTQILTVDGRSEKQKRGEENREKERKKSQQNNPFSSFDYQLVHRWIGLKVLQQLLDVLLFILNGWIEDGWRGSWPF